MQLQIEGIREQEQISEAKDLDQIELPPVGLQNTFDPNELQLEGGALHAVMTGDGRIEQESATFFTTTSAGIAAGGYFLRRGRSERFHVSGTTADGRYIPPHVLEEDGTIKLDFSQSPRILIQNAAALKEILNLTPDSSRQGVFRRFGFEGDYIPQQEADGSWSVFYSGGRHRSGIMLPPQTFRYGSWDLSADKQLSDRFSVSAGMGVGGAAGKSTVDFGLGEETIAYPAGDYDQASDGQEGIMDEYNGPEFEGSIPGMIASTSVTEGNPKLAKLKDEFRPYVRKLESAVSYHHKGGFDLGSNTSSIAPDALDNISRILFRKDHEVRRYQKQLVLRELFSEEIVANESPELYFNAKFGNVYITTYTSDETVAERAINLFAGINEDGSLRTELIAQRIYNAYKVNYAEYDLAAKYWMDIARKRGVLDEVKAQYRQLYGKPMVQDLVLEAESYQDWHWDSSDWLLMKGLYGEDVSHFAYDLYYRRPTTRGLFGETEYDLVIRAGKIKAKDEEGSTWKYVIENPRRLAEVQEAFDEFYSAWGMDSLQETISYRYSGYPEYASALKLLLQAVRQEMKEIDTNSDKRTTSLEIEVNIEDGNYKVLSRKPK